MSKRYHLSLFGYITIAIFVILFFLVMYGASGHRYHFSLEDFLVPACAAVTSLILLLYPRIPENSKGMKAGICFLAVGLLIINLYFVLTYYLSFYSENYIIGFMIFSTVIVGLFSTAILTLIIESVKELFISFTKKDFKPQ
jgi:hypothetical protein